jgi:hypothetical protein
MNERIKELAEQAFMVCLKGLDEKYEQQLERFAELVRQDEREQWDTSDMAHRSGGLSVEQTEKQEPVPVGMTCKVWTHGCALFDGIDLPNETLLYTAPPPRKEWVGLTDEEIDYIWGISPPDYEKFFDFPRAIEAKLKEKNT